MMVIMVVVVVVGIHNAWLRVISINVFTSLARNTGSVGSFESHLGVTTWSTNEQPFDVSVNKNHNVLVATVNAYGSVHAVQEYTTYGVFVQQVNLLLDITQFRQVMQLPNGLYGVIHTG